MKIFAQVVQFIDSEDFDDQLQIMLVGGVGGDSSTVQSVKLALCNHISLKTLLIWSIFNILSFSFSGKLNYLTLTDPSKVWMPALKNTQFKLFYITFTYGL